MKIDRTKNASRNIIFGMGLKIYQIICPFVIRTVMIYILGIEYVGLNSLFSAILQVLNLTELGVGTAMVFSMYKPIAEDDTEQICCLLALYKKYYFIIGLIIAIVGLAITPIVPHLISSDSNVPLNIYYLYWLNLAGTVISYWLLAYRGSILQAFQRNDIISKITLVTNTLTYLVQFLVLFLCKNYYFYLIIMLGGQAVSNLVTAAVARSMYPKLEARGKLSIEQKKEITMRVKDLFTAKVGGVIQNSVDAIVISAFLGLSILAKYNNYYYIMNSVFGLIVILFSSCTAGIGNSLVTETKEKNYEDLKKVAFIICWIVGVCAACMLCLFQPFMKIWVGEENTLSLGVVISIVIYFWIICLNQMLCLYKDASGIWHKDRFRPLITAMVNLILNLLTVHLCGIYGVIFSTILSMSFVGMPWLIENLFSEVFGRGKEEFVRALFGYSLNAIVACVLTYVICCWIHGEGFIFLIIRAVVCVAVSNAYFWVVMHNRQEYEAAKKLVGRIIVDKIPLDRNRKKEGRQTCIQILEMCRF